MRLIASHRRRHWSCDDSEPSASESAFGDRTIIKAYASAAGRGDAVYRSAWIHDEVARCNPDRCLHPRMRRSRPMVGRAYGTARLLSSDEADGGVAAARRGLDLVPCSGSGLC